jgi:hypothetical protein
MTVYGCFLDGFLFKFADSIHPILKKLVDVREVGVREMGVRNMWV